MSSSSQFPPQGAKVPPQGINVDQQLTDQFRENYKASSKKSSPIINKMGQTVNTAATDSRLIGSATGKELSGRVSLVLDNLLAVGSYVLSSIAATASRIFGFSENPGLKKELSPEQKAVGRENIQKTGEMFGVDLGLKATPKKAAEPAPKPVTEQKRRETIQDLGKAYGLDDKEIEDLASRRPSNPPRPPSMPNPEAEASEVADKTADILSQFDAEISKSSSVPAQNTPTPTPTSTTSVEKGKAKLSPQDEKFLKYIKDSIEYLKAQLSDLNLNPNDEKSIKLNRIISDMNKLISSFNPLDPQRESRTNEKLAALNDEWNAAY